MPKTFRSPREFFEHLLWLITDTNLKRENCQCKNCKVIISPAAPVPGDQSDAGTPSSGDPSASGGPSTSGGPSSSSAAPKASERKGTSTQPTSGPQSTTNNTAIQSALGSALGSAISSTPQSAIRAPARPVPEMQPVPQTQPDESVLFREGEVVWFKTDTGAFRLGLVRANLPSSMNRITPLSHYEYPIHNIDRFEAETRPFLTFSVPVLQPAVEHVADQPMKTVNWNAVEVPYAENMKAEIISMEASKIAASHVDHSYSLFNFMNTREALFGQLSFGGVFLGCEKVGILEAVRVRLEPHEHPHWDQHQVTFVMVVKNITLQRSAVGQELTFGGDIWLLQEGPLTHQDQLPAAMQREKTFRDQVARARGSQFNWFPVARNVVKPEKAIRGRFYESQKLGPSLITRWDSALEQGEVPQIQTSLNNRFDSRGEYIGRMPSRSETVAGAVPPGTVLGFGPNVVEWD